MQTSRTRVERCHCRFAAAALAADKAQMSRVRALVTPVLADSWVAAVGQPSPMAGFALVVLAELGGGLLRLPAMQPVVAAWSRLVIRAAATLVFQLAGDRQAQIPCQPGKPPANDAKRPAFILLSLCNVKHQCDGRGITLRTTVRSTTQHPPGSTS